MGWVARDAGDGWSETECAVQPVMARAAANTTTAMARTGRMVTSPDEAPPCGSQAAASRTRSMALPALRHPLLADRHHLAMADRDPKHRPRARAREPGRQLGEGHGDALVAAGQLVDGDRRVGQHGQGAQPGADVANVVM